MGYQARCQHVPRIAMAGMIVDHEILWEHLQDHPVLLKLHAGGAVHHPVYIPLLDLARAAKLENAPAVGAADRSAADADDSRVDGELGALLGLAQGRQNRFGNSGLIGNPALSPAGRRRLAQADQPDLLLFQQAHNAPGAAAARIQSYRLKSPDSHFYSLAVMRSSNRKSNVFTFSERF